MPLAGVKDFDMASNEVLYINLYNFDASRNYNNANIALLHANYQENIVEEALQ